MLVAAFTCSFIRTVDLPAKRIRKQMGGKKAPYGRLLYLSRIPGRLRLIRVQPEAAMVYIHLEYRYIPTIASGNKRII